VRHTISGLWKKERDGLPPFLVGRLDDKSLDALRNVLADMPPNEEVSVFVFPREKRADTHPKAPGYDLVLMTREKQESEPPKEEEDGSLPF
jgi:hypothetical protein